MVKREAVGVEKRPIVKIFLPINRITDYRTANMFKVNANLMCSACFRLGEDKACPLIKSRYLNFGDRLSPIRQYGHLFPVAGVAADRHVDGHI